MALAPIYDPKDYENNIYQLWQSQKVGSPSVLLNNLFNKNLVDKNNSNLDFNNFENDFDSFYPSIEMITAREIFYIWIIRMATLSKYFTGQVPFTKIIITPTIQDELGRKMSKSLKNGLDPVLAIDKYSSDSLRMALLSGMYPNRNMRMGGKLADTMCEKYRNFGNKLWNVARFLESKELVVAE